MLEEEVDGVVENMLEVSFELQGTDEFFQDVLEDLREVVDNVKKIYRADSL